MSERIFDIIDAHAIFDAVKTSQIGAHLARHNDIVDRQSILAVRQGNFFDRDAKSFETLECLIHNRPDARIQTFRKIFCWYADRESFYITSKILFKGLIIAAWSGRRVFLIKPSYPRKNYRHIFHTNPDGTDLIQTGCHRYQSKTRYASIRQFQPHDTAE